MVRRRDLEYVIDLVVEVDDISVVLGVERFAKYIPLVIDIDKI